jgi:hypothetical protein
LAQQWLILGGVGGDQLLQSRHVRHNHSRHVRHNHSRHVRHNHSRHVRHNHSGLAYHRRAMQSDKAAHTCNLFSGALFHVSVCCQFDGRLVLRHCACSRPLLVRCFD